MMWKLFLALLIFAAGFISGAVWEGSGRNPIQIPDVDDGGKSIERPAVMETAAAEEPVHFWDLPPVPRTDSPKPSTADTAPVVAVAAPAEKSEPVEEYPYEDTEPVQDQVFRID